MDMKDENSAPATKADIRALLSSLMTKEDAKSFAMKEDLKAFATKEDLKAFPTKGDLKAFATKEDLKAFATKEDLKAFATKEDLKPFATKDDVWAVHRKLALEIAKTQGQIVHLKETSRGETDWHVSNIFSKIDGCMSKVGKVDRAQVIADWRMAQLEKRVDKIETRPS